MICNCPKCHGKIELDLPEVTEAGTTAVCPACSARFNVYRESFGGRALRKSSELSCASCGSELGAQLHCPACGAQYPDYLVVSLGRKRVRKASKKLKLKTSPFPQPTKSATQLPTLEMSMRPETAKAAPVSPTSRYPKAAVITVALLVVVALAAAGSFLYTKNKQEKTYVKNFVLATYCIQTGYDRALKANTRILTEWKAKSDAGQSYGARASMADEKDFGIINGKLDVALGKLSNPPEKFAAFNDKLTKFQGIYAKARSLTLAPGNSMQSFADATSKLEADYKQATKEYKSGLPDEIMDELVSASLKFKGLRPLLR